MSKDRNASFYKTVSVVGQSRIGKSTFQRHLFPGVNFKTDSDIQQPCTQGIDAFKKLQNLHGEEIFVLDCQGFNNQFDVKVEIGKEDDRDAWKGGGQDEATKMQDIILFAVTALFSQVILYYYPVAMDMNQIAIITGACELLDVWSKELKFMRCKNKPKLVFLRRNMPVESD